MLKLIIIASVALSTPLPAQEPAARPSITVGATDLDLATDAGRTRLDRRLDAAVAKLCGRSDIADLRTALDQRACRAAARSSAEQARAVAVARSAATRLASIEQPR